MQQLSVSRLFDGQYWHQDVSVSFQDGVIQAITPASGIVQDGMLVPGFIDVQVNGGGGVLFNTTPELQTLSTMLLAHNRYGTTAMLPTVITDSIETMQRSADAVAQAIAAGAPGILGVHFEGPHLSVPKKGVHPERHIRSLSADELALYGRTDLGIKLVTVAPENVSPQQIRELVAHNVIVCLGHSNADAATVQAALEAGATGFTHLYNAMSPLTSREPGMVGVALADPDSWCGVIFDGHHMHPTAARVALAAKPKGKLLIVTDAMSPVGTDETRFELMNNTVTRDGDKLTDEAGRLAGSVLDMAGAVRYAIESLGVVPDEALRMASLYPAQFLKLRQHGTIAAGAPADLVLLNKNWQVTASWIGGRQTF